MFFWQACNSYLPTTDLLIIKCVPCNPIYQLCFKGIESILHLFVCEFAKKCWSKVLRVVLQDVLASFVDWINLNFNALNDNNCCSLIMNCWSIWKARNRSRMEKTYKLYSL